MISSVCIIVYVQLFAYIPSNCSSPCHFKASIKEKEVCESDIYSKSQNSDEKLRFKVTFKLKEVL